ncbi:hypothetical protein G6F40_018085 [Rhizopus arrhizus]|nr:hypothetical protein G6F24_017433 [Rhizopus arrhizus]KAG1060132.1 hypothetical protein G6F40_018085 [Rhizopus arrhizus]
MHAAVAELIAELQPQRLPDQLFQLQSRLDREQIDAVRKRRGHRFGAVEALDQERVRIQSGFDADQASVLVQALQRGAGKQ